MGLMRISAANCITFVRIFCSIALLFFPALSTGWFILYTIAGITDVLDGVVARKTNTDSVFGSKFDTVSDFIFVAVCLIRLLPVIPVPIWMYGWVAGIAAIKGANVIFGFVIHKEYVAVHSAMNKLTGILLFVLPFAWERIPCSGMAVCAVATFAALEEAHIIWINSRRNTLER